MLLLEDLLDLVLPRACAGCGAGGPVLCPACRTGLAGPVLGPVAPDPSPPGLPATCAARAYDGVVPALLLAHKEHGRLALVEPLGALLAAAARCHAPPPGAVLVPVPSSRAAVRARGHDHAGRLARAAGARLGLPTRALLTPARAVADQAGLSAAERADNLRGGLRARGRLDGLAVLVVDDVVTTGATLVEAARALTAGGARVLGAATVAATARRPLPPRASSGTSGG